MTKWPRGARRRLDADVDDVDLNAVRRFYLDIADRIKQALA